MLSSNNILSPANGRPLATPTQDMVLGGYYLTYSATDLVSKSSEELDPRPKRFSAEEDVEMAVEDGIRRYRAEDDVQFAVEAKQVGLQEPIEYRWDGELVLTTPGRVIFNSEVQSCLADAVGDGDASKHSFINRMPSVACP